MQLFVNYSWPYWHKYLIADLRDLGPQSNIPSDSVRCLFYACLLFDLSFNPEKRGDIFLRNGGWLSTNYTALYTGRQNS
jgi:hypothetical protein